jgi:hypothetical protein
MLAPRPAADGGALMPALGLAPDTIGADVPLSLRTELRRAGFIELDAPDRAGWARYIAGDRVAEVVGQFVRLSPRPTDARDIRPPLHVEGLSPPRGAARVVADPSPTGPSGARSTRGLAWLLGAAAALAGGGLVGLWLYRRRREEARLHRRVRRAAGALADQLPERGGARAGGSGSRSCWSRWWSGRPDQPGSAGHPNPCRIGRKGLGDQAGRTGGSTLRCPTVGQLGRRSSASSRRAAELAATSTGWS